METAHRFATLATISLLFFVTVILFVTRVDLRLEQEARLKAEKALSNRIYRQYREHKDEWKCEPEMIQQLAGEVNELQNRVGELEDAKKQVQHRTCKEHLD